jgi:hypothetical protein
MMSKKLSLIIFLIPFIIFGIYQFLKFNSTPPDLNKKNLGLFLFYLVKQEGILDALQFPIYLMVFILIISIFRKSSGLESIIYLLYSFVILFVAFEEISWGQNFIPFSNPEYFDVNNLQQETNLHNLSNFQFLTHLAFIVVGILFSFGSIFSKIKPIRPIIKNIIPSWKYIGYNLPLAIFYYLFITNDNKESLLTNITQEYFEFMFSLGLLIFMLERWKISKSNVR